MNKRIVLYTLGRIIQMNGVLLLFPMIVSLIYQEPTEYFLSFAVVSAASLIIGYFLSREAPEINKMYAKEGFVIVSLSWIILSFVGAVPFVINGDIPSMVDAFFEMASGFTTTGSTILDDVEALAHSSLFWRSFSHFIGGMGVLVFALAILPKMKSEAVHIMRAEVPGPSFGKLLSKVSSTARILYIIYLCLTIALMFILYIAGMPIFDSILNAFGVAGTGGFGILNDGIAAYDSLTIEIILGIGMLVFGVNFNLYYYLLLKNIKEVYNSEELRWYFGIIFGTILAITAQLTIQSIQPFSEALRNSFFSVSAVITTTGFTTDNFGNWPLFSQIIIFLLMFVGGMAGSTGGGLKVSRIAIIIKTALSELKRIAYPNRVVSVHFEGKKIEDRMLKAVSSYFLIYILLFCTFLLLISFDLPDFLSAVSTVATMLNNIGPGLGIVGPDASFSLLNPFSKIILSIAMIMGRLEIFPILILFSPSIWRKRA